MSLARFSRRAAVPLLPGALALVAAVALSACEPRYAPRPLPEAFQVRTLDGEPLSAAQMRGRPWLVNLWLPG